MEGLASQIIIVTIIVVSRFLWLYDTIRAWPKINIIEKIY